MHNEFQRVAIVNRGEAAMRFIHAAREFNQENNTKLRTIALFTEPDRHAMYVREADEAISLGVPHIIDPVTRQSRSSYVDYERLDRPAAPSSDGDARLLGKVLGGNLISEPAHHVPVRPNKNDAEVPA